MKIVLTGGPHSGKTILIEYFRNKGYSVVSEVAMEILNRKKGQLGEKYSEWLSNNVLEFQEENVKKQLEAESILDKNNLYFLDRGLLDPLAYSKAKNLNISHIIENTRLLALGRYKNIFLLDQIKPFDRREESGRYSFNEEFSLKLERELQRIYLNSGYNPIRVKQMSLEERANLILQNI